MTYIGVAVSGELLHSTNDEGLFDFAGLNGDVFGLRHDTVVQAIRTVPVATGSGPGGALNPNIGDALVFDGTEFSPSGVSGGVTPHALLGAQHTDTVANTPTRGSIIYGNATPAWDELVLGAQGFVLYSDGTDILYTQLGAVTPFATGSPLNPSVTFVGDLDTGWSSQLPDILVGSASGLGLIRIDGVQQAIDLDAAQVVRTRAVGANTNVLLRDYVITCTAAPITVTLPASPTEGRELVIKDRDGNASNSNRITIAGNGNNIDGNANIEIRNSYGSFTILFSGTEWNVI